MLVLTRKPGEKIVVDNGLIEITVLEIKGRTVRLGIKAPGSYRIVRAELLEEDGGEEGKNAGE